MKKDPETGSIIKRTMIGNQGMQDEALKNRIAKRRKELSGAITMKRRDGTFFI